MQLAVQETLLPGDTVKERLMYAQTLGLEGVEFDAEGLTERVPEINEMLAGTGLKTSVVNVGKVPLLHPELDERDKAIRIIKQSMANALDLGTTGVMFIPHDTDTPRLPDLRPYKSSLELEIELLLNLLKSTLADLAYAMGAELLLAPVNRNETHLVRRLDQAVSVRHRCKDHPHLKIAADTGHMAVEEDDLIAALGEHVAHLGYVRVRGGDGNQSAQNPIAISTVISTLRTGDYRGWVTLAGDAPSAGFRTDLSESVALLKNAVAG
jgi:sugar phosphate isomerase/epimerase